VRSTLAAGGRPPRFVRGALGACGGLLAAISFYPLLRVVAALSGHEPNPAIPVEGGVIPYFWRVWTCAFAAAMVALLIGAFARDTHRVARALLRALPWTVGVLVVQAIVLP
jgi:hypothetical protein